MKPSRRTGPENSWGASTSSIPQIHGSCLNLAEAEFSILQRQCLDRRLPEISALERKTHRWFHQGNQLQVGTDWQFTTQDAGIKLKRLYPSFED